MKKCAGGLLGFVFPLPINNVISRSLTWPIFWIGELAVNTMIWVAFIGTSIGINQSSHIAVTLIADTLPKSAGMLLRVIVDTALILVLAVLSALLWR